MQAPAHPRIAETPIGWVIGEAREKGGRLVRGLAEVFTVCANARAASVLYEELSRLSDAELERRGIPRGELHRCVFDTLANQHKPA